MSEPARNVLIVEDEAHMRRFLRTALGHHGYQPVEAATGKRAWSWCSPGVIDVVLLDLGLPDIDGIEVAGRIREQAEVPIIVSRRGTSITQRSRHSIVGRTTMSRSRSVQANCSPASASSFAWLP